MPYLVAEKFHKIFPDGQIVDIGHDLRMIRAVKSPAEVELQRGGQTGGGGASLCRRSLGTGTGLTELELG